MRTALIVGATGVTGKSIVEACLRSDTYRTVKIFVRRDPNVMHDKLVTHVVDFDVVDEWQHLLQGDDMFSALGTTLRLAGSQQAQYLVDYTYQLRVATAASHNQVRNFYLVSSPGANPKSPFFYTRMKGELDRDVAKLPFQTTALVKPMLICGDRPDTRVLESLAAKAFRFNKFLPILSRYRPLQGRELGEAIVRFAEDRANQTHGAGVIYLDMKQLAQWL